MLCIATNIYALLMFVVLFIYAFFHFQKEGKFFYGIAILNAAFATTQVVSAQAFFQETRQVLMALLAIHMGLLVGFIVLLNVDSKKALSVMKMAIVVRILYHVVELLIYVTQNNLTSAMSLMPEDVNAFGVLLLNAKLLIPLLIDTSVYLCYKAILKYSKD